jgi:hypothetical protein
MVQDYLFGGAYVSISEYQYVFGYQDTKIDHLYDESTVQEGKELHLDDNVNQIINEQSTVFKNQTIGMFTGAIKKDETSKIRFLNDKNYVNKKINIFDGKKIHSLPVSPTAKLQKLDLLYNGMQFAPN